MNYRTGAFSMIYICLEKVTPPQKKLLDFPQQDTLQYGFFFMVDDFGLI